MTLNVIARSTYDEPIQFFVWGAGLLPCARNDGVTLMIIPRNADGAGDVVIAGGELHAGAGSLLADGRAIELLPGRLVGRVLEAAIGLELGVPLLELFI